MEYESYYVVNDFDNSWIKGSFYEVDPEKGRLTFDQTRANLLTDLEENVRLYKLAISRIKKLKKSNVE